MIGASGLLDSKQSTTENFFELIQEENKAFEQKTLFHLSFPPTTKSTKDQTFI